jgi:hypothetical protein
MVVEGIKPIGIYFRLSEETLGIIMYSVSLCEMKANFAGVSAKIRVSSLELANLKSLTLLSLSDIKADFLIIDGSASLSQRQ